MIAEAYFKLPLSAVLTDPISRGVTDGQSVLIEADWSICAKLHRGCYFSSVHGAEGPSVGSEIINLKATVKMKIYTYGKDPRLLFCKKHLEDKKITSVKEMILLPVPSSRDGITVTGTGEALEDIASGAAPGCTIVGYEIPRSMRKHCCEGVLVSDVALDERFLEENARLTALGTVGRLLTSEGRAICGLTIGVIGYGRIGRLLVRYLLFLGADVRVFTSKNSTISDLGMIGVRAENTALISECADCDDSPLSGLDVLINTAPAGLITEEWAPTLRSTRVIELASGKNIPDCIVQERFAAIPCVMYPDTAGKVMCDSVLRMLGGAD